MLIKFTAKGRIPIKKNISVVDEQGNEYEATYPKRAKGLVKKGRARFISENMICLACPPNELEDNIMQNIENDTEKTKPLLKYILEQMDKIVSQTDYLLKTIESLEKSSVGAGPVDDELCRLKIESLGNVVTCRETTNQQLLRFYEKMYDDLKESTPAKVISLFEEMTDFLKSLNKDDFPEETWEYINGAVQTQLVFNAARGW